MVNIQFIAMRSETKTTEIAIGIGALRSYIVLLISMCCSQSSLAQHTMASGTYKVEAPKFSPPIQDMANSFLEKPASALQAN